MKEKIHELKDQTKKQLTDTVKKVRDAPRLFRNKIYMLAAVIAFMCVLAVVSLLLSVIPAMGSVRAVSAIAVIAALYFGMALPRWVRTIDAHEEFTGKVVSIKQKQKLTESAKRVFNSNNRAFLLTTVNIDGVEQKIELPKTASFSIAEGITYRFYYATDDDRINGYVIDNFLFFEKVRGVEDSAETQTDDLLEDITEEVLAETQKTDEDNE